MKIVTLVLTDEWNGRAPGRVVQVDELRAERLLETGTARLQVPTPPLPELEEEEADEAAE